MNSTKKKHNWKARRETKTEIDKSEEKKIVIDIKGADDYNVDTQDNVLVLPSKKRKTKTKIVGAPQKRLLSKKQRKQLERVLDIKEKKLKRADLIESLKTNKISREELALFTSTSQMQTRQDNKMIQTSTVFPNNDLERINAVKCSRKGRKRKAPKPVQEAPTPHEESDTSGFTSSEYEEENMDIVEKVSLEAERDDLDKSAPTSSPSTKRRCPDTSTTSTTPDSTTTSTPTTTPASSSPVLSFKPPSAPPPTLTSSSNETTAKTTPQISKLTVYIQLDRDPKIQEQRLQLPVLAEEQVIMEKVKQYPTVVLCGATGSGKTTQVPQFLYEAGYASDGKMIGVTEPRRVAAISMSKRVSIEMNVPQDIVSYQIRYEGNTTPNTKIKFQTDGVLLKEIQKDFLLEKYSVIIIDEAHERSVFTDILIGLLSRIVNLRNKKGIPLKLIIMSATLRIQDFTMNTSLFKTPPPVIEVEARQHPVTIHFNRKTHEDYLGEAFKKICKIHAELPEGGILVFVTGQLEVNQLCSKLKSSFPSHSSIDPETSSKKMKKIDLDSFSTIPAEEHVDVENEEAFSEVNESSKTVINCKNPVYVLPLYSLLSSARQAKVFESPPENCRMIIVATNVAETSLTIPNVKYVVDTGKVKTKFYDKVTGVSTFKVTNTSQASANQRAGRAGRTGPGHCYRLYSSAVFNDTFPEFSIPEIMRRPVDDLILQMKDMGIDKVVNFPFPSNPGIESLQVAEKLLQSLGAIQPNKEYANKRQAYLERCSSRITDLGHKMASFPVAPRYARMLAMAAEHSSTTILEYVIAIVSALSVQEVFDDEALSGDTQDDTIKQKKMKLKQQMIMWAGQGESWLLGDIMVLLKAVGAAEYNNCSPAFFLRYSIRVKAMAEIRKLRLQLTKAVNSVVSNCDACVNPKMSPPSQDEATSLREIVLSGFGDQIARKVIITGSENDKSNKDLKYAFKTLSMEEHVYIHPSSVFYKKDIEFVCYQRIDETSKPYMKGVFVVDVKWLPVHSKSFCRFNKPDKDPSPRFDQPTGTVKCHMSCSFGGHFWSIPSTELEYPAGLDKYKWFARFLLEGLITDDQEICQLSKHFLLSPVTMVKPWANLQKRTETFLKQLIHEKVDTKEKLYCVWKKNNLFLQKEFLEWLPESLHEQCKKKWNLIIQNKS